MIASVNGTTVTDPLDVVAGHTVATILTDGGTDKAPAVAAMTTEVEDGTVRAGVSRGETGATLAAVPIDPSRPRYS